MTNIGYSILPLDSPYGLSSILPITFWVSILLLAACVAFSRNEKPWFLFCILLLFALIIIGSAPLLEGAPYHYDSYWHAASVDYITSTGHLNAQAFPYQHEYFTFSIIISFIVTVGIPLQGLIQYAPIFYGVLGCLFTYYLVKKLTNNDYYALLGTTLIISGNYLLDLHLSPNGLNSILVILFIALLVKDDWSKKNWPIIILVFAALLTTDPIQPTIILLWLFSAVLAYFVIKRINRLKIANKIIPINVWLVVVLTILFFAWLLYVSLSVMQSYVELIQNAFSYYSITIGYQAVSTPTSVQIYEKIAMYVSNAIFVVFLLAAGLSHIKNRNYNELCRLIVPAVLFLFVEFVVLRYVFFNMTGFLGRAYFYFVIFTVLGLLSTVSYFRSHTRFRRINKLKTILILFLVLSVLFISGFFVAHYSDNYYIVRPETTHYMIFLAHNMPERSILWSFCGHILIYWNQTLTYTDLTNQNNLPMANTNAADLIVFGNDASFFYAQTSVESFRVNAENNMIISINYDKVYDASFARIYCRASQS